MVVALTVILTVADVTITAAIIAQLIRRPNPTAPPSLEGGPPMPYAVGDHVNVLPPFADAMPPVEGGYRIIAVNSYVDGITNEVGQTCTLVLDANLFDFAGQYLEPYTPPEAPGE